MFETPGLGMCKLALQHLNIDKGKAIEVAEETIAGIFVLGP